jgi:uncharacterized protein (DUF1330 family)
MPAYMVFTREKTRNAAKLAEYKQLVPPTFVEHPVAVRASHGRYEVLEGPATEEVIILEFANYDAAKAWYDSPEYQAARQHRFQGGDYRCIIHRGQDVTAVWARHPGA